MRIAVLLFAMGMLGLGGAPAVALAGEVLSEGFQAAAPGPLDEMTPAERDAIWRMLDGERAGLVLPKAGPRPLFRWPLRAVRGISDPVFSRVVNHVDHDPLFPDRLRDYNCGTRTYDRDDGYNHTGTDIGIVPDQWNLMIAGQVEIVAAAPGTIISKVDGNFDQSCARNIGAQWNAVYVQHDDGSTAWYGHMKNGSTTTKSVGSRVAAGEYLGKVGASGNASAPHLHFEVFDSERRLVDPFKGTCNLRNADSWWEAQPPYRSTEVMAVTTASAAPTSSVCGADGRLQSPGDYHRKSAFARGEVVWLVASVRDLPKGERVRHLLRAPDGSTWSQIENSAAAEDMASSTWWASVRLGTSAPLGNWMYEGRVGDSSAQVPFTLTADGAAIADYTDLWWNPAEPGWGVNLSQQGEKLFATWFTYDADGSGMWLVMSDGLPQAGGAIGGALYRASGVPFEQINGRPAANFPLANVGSLSLRFADAEHATMSYTVNGVSQSKGLVRQRFSTATRCMQSRAPRTFATNYQDLWWNPSEPGWGINLAHQGDSIFATWFTYGGGGRGAWFVASDVRRQPTGEFRGRLYRTTGRAFDRIEGTSALTGDPVDVGEIVLAFADGEHGRLDYSVGGISQSKAITRQVFGESAPLCR